MSSPRKLRLGVFAWGPGHHVAAWRHPAVDPRAGESFGHYLEIARIAEAARFDLLFSADGLAADGPHPGAARIEPVLLMAALASVTSRIGLISTATTTYNEPFHIARRFASLDHLSGGRAGWNLVTSDNSAEAGNFGRAEHVAHADRYARAEEFLSVVTGLWDGWARDALVLDQATGVFLDPDKVSPLNHIGEHFRVRGPLNVSRSPQGRPIVVQAGSSEAGRNLAARTAEVIFTAQPNFAKARAFYSDLKQRAATFGRSPDSLRIMPGLYAVVGATREEAQRKHEELQKLIRPADGLALLGRMIGNFDLTGFPVDGPLPPLPITQTGQRSRQELFQTLAADEGLSIRQLYERIAGGRGHFTIIGTGTDVADQLQQWLEGGAADGFNLMAPTLPGGLADFVEHVVPELRRRGLFRTEYEGTTLRENLGLPTQ